MKKKLFLGILPLMALALSACGGGGNPSSQQSQQDPSSQQSEPQSQPGPSSEAGTSQNPSEDPSSEAGPSEDPSSEDESSDDESSEQREASGHTIRYGGGLINLYVDENYDPLTDEWGGIAKFISDPFDVTLDDSIVVYNSDEEAIYANAYDLENNVKTTTPDDPTSYQIRATAEDAVLSLYQYDDGWAFTLSGYTGGDEPVVSGAKIGIAVAGDWTNINYVELVVNPDNENEVMKQGLALGEGDLFYIDLGDGKNYLHYSDLENAGAAANFEDDGGSDHNVKVKTAGTYDLYATIGKLYIGLPGGEDPELDPEDEPVISGGKIGIAPAGVWGSVKYVALIPNPGNENEIMAQGVELAEGDLFYIDFGDGQHWLHYTDLENDGAAACFEDDGGSDHNLKVVTAGTYDFYVTTSKIYIGVPNAE